MQKYFIIIIFVVLLIKSKAQDGKLPIIDIHLHAYTSWIHGTKDSTWIPLYLTMPSTDREMMEKSLQQLRKYKIVQMVTSRDINTVKIWYPADSL